jgi:hypothetical protein
LVKRVVTLKLGSIVCEHLLPQTIKRDAFEKPGWNDPIGINVVPC